jgi:hypothetical protein
MGPNEADIIRVWTRETGGVVADNTLDPNVDAEVVVEVGAGSAAFASGGAWQIGITVKDLDGGVITFTPGVMNGHWPSAPWTAQQAILSYTIPKASLALHKGHLGRVYAYLLTGTGAANYDATFLESELFLVLP